MTNGVGVSQPFRDKSLAIELPPLATTLLCWPYRNCIRCCWDTGVIAVNRICNQLCPWPQNSLYRFFLIYSAYDTFCGMCMKLVIKSKFWFIIVIVTATTTESEKILLILDSVLYLLQPERIQNCVRMWSVFKCMEDSSLNPVFRNMFRQAT